MLRLEVVLVWMMLAEVLRLLVGLIELLVYISGLRRSWLVLLLSQRLLSLNLRLEMSNRLLWCCSLLRLLRLRLSLGLSLLLMVMKLSQRRLRMKMLLLRLLR